MIKKSFEEYINFIETNIFHQNISKNSDPTIKDIIRNFHNIYYMHGRDVFNHLVNTINSYKIGDVFELNNNEKLFSFYDNNNNISTYIFVFIRLGYLQEIKNSKTSYKIISKIPDIINNYNNNDIKKELTIEDCENLIEQITDKLSDMHNFNSIYTRQHIYKFYFGDKKIFNVLIELINDREEGNIFNIYDSILFKLSIYERKSLKCYISGLDRCGFIKKMDKKGNIKLLNKISINIKTSDLSQKNKIKIIQRKNKIKELINE